MGSKFHISLISGSQNEADHLFYDAYSEILRIEKLISSWDEISETSRINNSAGVKAIKVDLELYDLINRSIKISELTQGAFDITFGSGDSEFWKFDEQIDKLPEDTIVRSNRRLIGYTRIILNEEDTSVYLPLKGMKFGFGAIGKGYAADKTSLLLKSKGVKSGVINAGGDLLTWGKLTDGSDWTIGIADPEKSELPFSFLKISDMAVVTSGDYEKFTEIDGKIYSHLIDPATALPVSNEINSVTIIAPSAEFADALATAVFVMGASEGMKLVNQLNQVDCLVLFKNGRLSSSTGIEINR